MTLEALRDALEQATGPDRELDLYIGSYFREGDFISENRMGSFRAGYDPLESVWARYTRSLDAAMTLVPEGAEYTLCTLYGIADFECPLNGGDDDLPLHVRRKDGNVILAICQWRVEYELAVKPTGGRKEDRK